MVFRSLNLLAAAKRVPLIKFRKGGGVTSAAAPVSSASTPLTVSSSGGASNVSHGREAIEDWQLPARYRRKPIDLSEMEYINRGGPA